MKSYLSMLLMVVMCKTLFAQSDSGVAFNKDVQWAAIVQKAKHANKLIFVDCYATWCVPCKKMDKEVFTKKEVGDYFNKNFICTKLQMDRSLKDDELTKSNYDVVDKFQKEYRITNYPTYLFITSDGKLIHKAIGYIEQQKLIKMARLIKQPNYVYNDPYKRYDSLVRLYRKGKPVYSQMPYMIEVAKKINEISVFDSLNKDYYSYLKGLKHKQLLTKPIIEFLSENIINIRDPFVKIFSNYGTEINSIMKDSAYSRISLDIIIAKHIIDSVIYGFCKVVSFDSIKHKGAEPSWDAIYSIVNNTFGNSYAERAVRAAKVKLFRAINEYRKVARLVDMQIKMKELNLSDQQVILWVNDDAWRIFLDYPDRETMELAISWMKHVVYELRNPLPNWMDTYANLLYKASYLGYVNKFDEAIAMEKKAVDSALKLSAISNDGAFWKNQSEMFNDTHVKMGRGIKTWDH